MANRQAILYMTLSALFFTMLNSAIRFVDHFPTFQLVFFRCFGSVICGVVVLKRLKVSFVGNNQRMLIIRGLVGVTSMAFYFKALQLMPMGSAISLRYLSPFFAAAFAVLLLKEKMVKLQWLCFSAAFFGVVLLKGFDHRITLIALTVILSSAFFSGLVYVIIRKIGKTEHPVVIVNYFMCIAAMVGGFFSLFNWVQPEGIQWLIILSMGFFGFTAQLYMTKALQLAEANLITPFKYSEVVFTLLSGWLFFGEYQNWIAVLGMAIIILALIANVIVKERSQSLSK